MLCIALACSFPFSERINSVLSAFLIGAWLFDKQLPQKFKIAFRYKWVWLLCGFFLFYLIASLWSDNGYEAGQTLQRKLSFIIFPIIFAGEQLFNRARINSLVKYFILACAISLLMSEVQGIYHYFSLQRNDYLSYELFSYLFMHPGYYSNYFLIAVFFLGIGLTQADSYFQFPRKWAIVLLLFFVVGLGQLTSKTAMIVLLLFGALILYRTIFSRASIRFKVVVSTAVLLSVLIVSITTYSLISNRLLMIKQEIQEGTSKTVKFANSIGSRATAYKVEYNLIKERPLGYGTGMANWVLLNRLKEDGYDDLVKFNMHTHNQLLQTGLDLGYPGMFYLLFILLGLLIYFYQKKDDIGLSVSLLITVNCLTDDMLNIQAGVVPFLFFISLLLFRDIHKSKNVV